MLITHLPFNLPGKVFRSAMPFSYFDMKFGLLDEYKANDIDMVVMLTSDEEAFQHTGLDLRKFYEESGFEVLHHPIIDFSTPKNMKAFSETVDKAIESASDGKNIVMHCYAGIGRAGMFASVMARRLLELEGDEAIAWVREHVTDAVQTPAQRKIVLKNAGKKSKAKKKS